MEKWQEEYEQHLKENYTCKVTNLPCSNCSKYGCDNREENKKTV